jgi:hypothetical protein
MKLRKSVVIIVIIACVVIITYASFHSVWEIHYLKSFYPKSFSVTEAGYAAIVEFIKIALISFPLLILIVICLFIIKSMKKEKE